MLASSNFDGFVRPLCSSRSPIPLPILHAPSIATARIKAITWISSAAVMSPISYSL